MSGLATFNLGIALLVVILFVDYARDMARVRAFGRGLISHPPEPHDPHEPLGLALTLASRIANRPQAPDPVYLSALLRSFGATGPAIIEQGGCCSGVSRLYMLVLQTFGIRANQITVYHRSGRAQHCLVEVHLPDVSAIVDPLYGVYYVDPEGNPAGLAALRAGTEIRYAEIPGALNPGYPENDYYDFNLLQTKTANWTMSWPRRTAYRSLRILLGDSVDRMRVPQLLESPQTLLAAMLVCTSALVSASMLAVRWIVAG